jgi:hypothetical protein
MVTGNIRAARMMLHPLAEVGDAVAAFALAETDDPIVLKQFATKGAEITADVGLAKSWYWKAKERDFEAASQHLERLGRLDD